MPTLFRVLTVIGLAIGLFYASMFVLANYFEPNERVLTKTLRNVTVK